MTYGQTKDTYGQMARGYVQVKDTYGQTAVTYGQQNSIHQKWLIINLMKINV